MNAGLKEAPKEQSAQEKAELNAKEMWRHHSKEKKNELLYGSISKTKETLKKMLIEAKGFYYKTNSEKKAFGEALLNIVNQERTKLRERHREKKHLETRTTLAKLGHISNEGQMDSENKIQEDEKAVKAWHKANDERINEIQQIKNIPQKSRENAKLILHQLNTGPSFSPEERSSIKISLMFMLAKQLHGTKTPDEYQITGLPLEVSQKVFFRVIQSKNVAQAVLDEIIDENKHWSKKKRETKSFLEQSDERKKEDVFMKQTRTSKSFMDKKMNPENVDPSIDWQKTDRVTHGQKTTQQEKPEERRADVTIPSTKPSIDWQKTSPETHGPKEKEISIVKPDVTITRKQPSIDMTGVDPSDHQKLREKLRERRRAESQKTQYLNPEQRREKMIDELKIRKELEEAQQAIDELLRFRAAFIKHSSNAYKDLQNFKDQKIDASETQKETIIEKLDQSQVALLKLNLHSAKNSLSRLQQKFSESGAKDSRFSSIGEEIQSLVDHLESLNQLSFRNKQTLDESMKQLENEAQETLGIVSIMQKHFKVGDSLLYRTNKGNFIKVKLLPIIEPDTYRVQNEVSNVVFFIKKENAGVQLNPEPKKPKRISRKAA